MKSLLPLCFLAAKVSLLWPFHAFGQVHGPICTWHLDPTSTMTIQWIEQINVEVPMNQWVVGRAGFGYADGDDTTSIAMQDRARSLYIRKEFALRALPTERNMRLFGTWDATARIDGEVRDLVLEFTFRGRGRISGQVHQGDASYDLTKMDVAGKSVILEWKQDDGGVDLTHRIEAEETDSGKLSGTLSVLDTNGAAKTTAEWHADLDPDSVRGFGRRGGRDREDDSIDPEDVTVTLRVRYDDAFIAYLNGTEIVRAGVESGSGRAVRGIEGHEAREEEEFELKSEHLALFRRGKNVLAIEGHNDEIDSSDFSLHPRLAIRVSGGRESSVIDRGETWQFYLGEEPENDWQRKMAGKDSLAVLPEINSQYQLRYALRGRQPSIPAEPEVLPFADTGHVIHRVILQDLEPGQGYAFTIHRNGSPYPLKNQKWFFKTAPATADEPVRFVTGGDMYHERPELDAMNRQAGYEQPLFALIGGDLAYANGRDAGRWYDWVDSWSDHAVTQDDYLVPMIAVIGNHECAENLNDIIDDRDKLRAWDPRQTAKFYFSLFPLPNDTTNFVIDFADYMSIVCLDSFHTQIPSDQTAWLEEVLKPRADVPNLFACYHRPGFGTQVKDDLKAVREEWAPLFERYGVDVAFENDHHVYKRTAPLRQGELHRDGVTYIGDGSWGVEVRDIPWDKVRRLGYIVRASSENHLIRVGLHEDRQQFDALDAKGRAIDSYMRFRPASPLETSSN